MLDVAYMCLMPSVGFILGICVMGALYEGVIFPQRLARLREDIAAKAQHIKIRRAPHSACGFTDQVSIETGQAHFTKA